jgi:hypothetical protein
MPTRQQPEKSALGFTAHDEMQFAEWCAFSAVRFCECVRAAGFFIQAEIGPKFTKEFCEASPLSRI